MEENNERERQSTESQQTKGDRPTKSQNVGGRFVVNASSDTVQNLEDVSEMISESVPVLIERFISEGLQREMNAIENDASLDIKDAIVIHAADRKRLLDISPNGFTSGKALVDWVVDLFSIRAKTEDMATVWPVTVVMSQKEMTRAMEQAKVWGKEYTAAEVVIGHIHETVKAEGGFYRSPERRRF